MMIDKVEIDEIDEFEDTMRLSADGRKIIVLKEEFNLMQAIAELSEYRGIFGTKSVELGHKSDEEAIAERLTAITDRLFCFDNFGICIITYEHIKKILELIDEKM